MIFLFKLEEVKEALAKIGIQGMSITEVSDLGAKGHKGVYRGTEYAVELAPKIKIEVVIPEQVVTQMLEGIAKAAKTGKIGDGKIFISPMEEAVRTRTGRKGRQPCNGRGASSGRIVLQKLKTSFPAGRSSPWKYRFEANRQRRRDTFCIYSAQSGKKPTGDPKIILF